MLSLGYAHVLIGLLVHVRCCAQRLYILTTSKDSGGRESLAPLFWGSWAEKFGNPWSSGFSLGCVSQQIINLDGQGDECRKC